MTVLILIKVVNLFGSLKVVQLRTDYEIYDCYPSNCGSIVSIHTAQDDDIVVIVMVLIDF